MSDAVRDALEAALDAWAAKLCAMPNIRERERYDAASAILRAALASGGWRGMESAPKDGTAILAIGMSFDGKKVYSEIGVVAWNERKQEWRYQADGMDAKESEGDTWTDYAAMSPATHWQPLPPAPEQSNG